MSSSVHDARHNLVDGIASSCFEGFGVTFVGTEGLIETSECLVEGNHLVDGSCGGASRIRLFGVERNLTIGEELLVVVSLVHHKLECTEWLRSVDVEDTRVTTNTIHTVCVIVASSYFSLNLFPLEAIAFWCATIDVNLCGTVVELSTS